MRDPVCGKVVDPLRARAVGIYAGTTQYFCSPECKASYSDPRTGPTLPNAGPGGTERRYTDEPLKDVAGDVSGQWFVQPRPQSPSPSVDGFDDLEAPPPLGVQPPSPSILVEVRASKPKRPLVLIAAIAAIVVIGLLLLVICTHAG
ncbi:MAG: hypothetical protein ABI321_04085 [Polyangia bacterium]